MHMSLSVISDLTTHNPFPLAQTAYVACRYSTHAIKAGNVSNFETYDVAVPSWMERAQPKRIAEYLAGRYCAQQALRQLLGQPSAVGAAADRSPIWPPGVCGAITHHDGFAAAIASHQSQHAGIGIDCEHVFSSQHKPRLEARLFTADELTRIEACSANTAQRAQLVTAIFSAKESLFKALYPRNQSFIGFHDYAFTHIRGQQLDFTPAANLQSNAGSYPSLSVQYRRINDLVMTAVALNCSTATASPQSTLVPSCAINA